MSGTLYVIALPIGNPLDLSPRAKEIVSKSHTVACEDTRVFDDLCKTIGIAHGKLVAYHDHNEREIWANLIEVLQGGHDVALVSDAGTPGISDPGHHLLTKAYEFKIPVRSLPGPSSVTAAISVCPIGGNQFAFLGFAPSNSEERRKLLRSRPQMRSVIFEAPHRIRDHLIDAADIIPDTKIFLARELTKTFEESLFGTPSELLSHISGERERGEFVLIYPPERQTLSTHELEPMIKRLLDQGRKPKDVLTLLSGQTDLKRADLYDLIQKVKSST